MSLGTFERETLAPIIRILAVVGHMVASVFVFITFCGCNVKLIKSKMFGVEGLSFHDYQSSYVNDYTCNSTMSCFRDAKPWRYDYEFTNLYWSPYAILLFVEVVSLGMAFVYTIKDSSMHSASLQQMFKKSCFYFENTPNFKYYMLILFTLSIGGSLAVYFVWYLSTRQSNLVEAVILGIVSFGLLFFNWTFESMVEEWCKKFQPLDALTDSDISLSPPVTVLPAGSATAPDNPMAVVPDQIPTAVVVGGQNMGGLMFPQRVWKIPSQFLSTQERQKIMLLQNKGNTVADIPEVIKPLLAPSTSNPTLNLEMAIQIRMHVILRYVEYACTAPLLYICIMSLVAVDPPYWATCMGAICIMACNLLGIPLHYMHIQERVIYDLRHPPKWNENQVYAIHVDPPLVAPADAVKVQPPQMPPDPKPALMPPPVPLPPPSLVVAPQPMPQGGGNPAEAAAIAEQQRREQAQAASMVRPPGLVVPTGYPPMNDQPPQGDIIISLHNNKPTTYTPSPANIAPPILPVAPYPHWANTQLSSVQSPWQSQKLLMQTESIRQAQLQQVTRVPVIYASIKGNQPMLKANSNGQDNYIIGYNEVIRTKQSSTFFQWALAMVTLGKWSSNWVTKMQYMQASVLALVLAMGMIIYVARDLMLSDILPRYVSFSLWVLVIMYSSFGVVAYLFYYLLEVTYWDVLDLAFDVLSVLAKVPIVLCLCFGYWAMPTNLCFQNYNNY